MEKINNRNYYERIRKQAGKNKCNREPEISIQNKGNERGEQLYAEVMEWYGGPACPAGAVQYYIADKGDVIIIGNRLVADGAVGRRGDYGFSIRNAHYADIQKASYCGARKKKKCRYEPVDHAP
jgi:hypothetical protein